MTFSSSTMSGGIVELFLKKGKNVLQLHFDFCAAPYNCRVNWQTARVCMFPIFQKNWTYNGKHYSLICVVNDISTAEPHQILIATQFFGS